MRDIVQPVTVPPYIPITRPKLLLYLCFRFDRSSAEEWKWGSVRLVSHAHMFDKCMRDDGMIGNRRKLSIYDSQAIRHYDAPNSMVLPPG